MRPRLYEVQELPRRRANLPLRLLAAYGELVFVGLVVVAFAVALLKWRSWL